MDKMLLRFENEYMKKYWEVQPQQWSNYFEDSNYNLSNVDADIYKISNVYHNKIQITDGKSEIATLIINKNLVDKNPLVSDLRNSI